MSFATRSLFVCLMALPVCAGAQFTVYTVANSELSNDLVSGLGLGTEGLWVATAHGLDRFDGTTWAHWNTTNSNLPSDIVTDLAVDSAGHLWSWNYDQGCSRFDGTTFEHYSVADGLGDEDGSNIMVLDNTVYAGTYSGLSRFENGSWTTYTIDNSGLPDNDVRDCAIDADGGLWIPTFGGGIAYFNGSWTIYNTGNSDLPYDDVWTARVHPDGHVWIGTRNGLVDYANGTFTVYTTSNSILEDDDIRSIEFGLFGEVIVCTRFGGVYIIDTDGTWTAYTTGNSNLPSNETWEALVDANGGLWVATSLGLATVQGWSIPLVVPERTAFADARVSITDGLLRVSLPEGTAQVLVLDHLGRTVWTSAGATATVQQDVRPLATGVYHVVLRNAVGQRVWRLFVG